MGTYMKFKAEKTKIYVIYEVRAAAALLLYFSTYYGTGNFFAENAALHKYNLYFPFFCFSSVYFMHVVLCSGGNAAQKRALHRCSSTLNIIAI